MLEACVRPFEILWTTAEESRAKPMVGKEERGLGFPCSLVFEPSKKIFSISYKITVGDKICDRLR